MEGFPRKARVTELRSFGKQVVSWKRLDTSIGNGAIEDFEYLLSTEDSRESKPMYKSVSKEYINGLPRRSQVKKSNLI